MITDQQSNIQHLRNILMNGKEMIDTRYGKKTRKGLEDLISRQIYGIPYDELSTQQKSPCVNKG